MDTNVATFLSVVPFLILIEYIREVDLLKRQLLLIYKQLNLTIKLHNYVVMCNRLLDFVYRYLKIYNNF